MKTYLAVLTLLVALSSGLWAYWDTDGLAGFSAQPDGTEIVYVTYGGKKFVDGYVVVYGSGGWWYYAELDARGEYVASPYKVGIDNPASNGIPINLQRSAVRQAEIDAAMIRKFDGRILTQPNGTMFHAYSGGPLPTKTCPTRAVSDEGCWPRTMGAPADGYVISIQIDLDIPLINYNGGDPFWAFVYNDESGWYYYAELDAQGEYPQGYVLDEQGYIRNAQGDYVASSYRVGIDDPPGYGATAVRERSWGAMKHLFRK